MPSLPEYAQVHEETLLLLIYFDELCSRNGVNYAMDGGTLLGAVRDGGFIPWDDDADVVLTRAEYEKLRDAARKGPLPEGMVFSEYSPQHPRMWLRREGRPGAWIDLFIFDPISENRIFRKLRILGCAFFLTFTKSRGSMETSRRSGAHSGAKMMLARLGYILGRPFSRKTRARMMDAWGKYAFRGKGTLIHRSNDQYAGLSKLLPASVVESYIRLPFEGLRLMAMSGYHEVLVSYYGEDYMTPVRYASHDNPAHKGFVETPEAPPDAGKQG